MNLTPTYFQTSRAYLIGIQNYNTLKLLSTPLQDIDDIRTSLLLHEFADSNIVVKKDATQDDIKTIVLNMIDEIDFRDRVIFYFAGHGIAHDSGDRPRGFLIPREGNRGDERTFVDMDWLSQKFARLRCKHFLLILDCCFAGSFRWSDNYRNAGLDQTKKIFREKFERFVSSETQAWHVITSSSYDEEAIDQLLNLGARENPRTENKNSPFASAVINALTGRANGYFEDGIITATRLYNYIDNYVANYLRENNIVQRQLPNYFPLQRSTKGQFVFLTPQLADSIIKNLPRLSDNNPYKGLASFKTADSYLFFGRRRVIESLKALLLKADPQEIILVSGSSGLGKSSLVMAGLIPAVLPQYPDSSLVAPIRPGDLKGNSDYIRHCREEIDSTSKPFILFIDQFEEMVTTCSEAQRILWEEFILLNLQNVNCRIIISLRSDFEPQLKDSAVVKSGLKNKFVIPPFERNEIIDIIAQPALQNVIQIEAASKSDIDASTFIERICSEAMQSAGSLPLLSFALEQWYKTNVEKTGNRFSLNEEYYNGIGGVNGALGTIIEGFISGLRNFNETENLKRLMLRMATVQDEGFSRAKVYDFELDIVKFDPETRSQRELLEELIKLRVITTNRGTGVFLKPHEQVYYEPAHDAVLTSWKLLWDWLNAEKINIPIYQQLSEDTQKWKSGKYRRSLLWPEGANLFLVRNEFLEKQVSGNKWKKLRNLAISTFSYGRRPPIVEKPNLFNLEERRFIKASLIRTRQIRARLNILFCIIVALGIAAVVFAVNASIQRRRAVRETNSRLAVMLANNSNTQEPTSAYNSIKEADSLDPDNQIILQDAFNLIVQNTVSFNFIPTAIIPLHQELYNLSFKDDNHLTVVPKSNESYQVDLKTGKLANLHLRSDLNFPDHPAGFWRKEPYSWDIVKSDPAATDAIAPNLVPGARFLIISPDHLCLGMFLGRAGLINTRDSCISEKLNFSGEIKYAKFLGDSTRALLVCEDNGIYFADFLNGKILELIKGYLVNRTSHYYNLSDDERMFAAVNSNRLVYVWDLNKENEFSSNGQEIRDSLFMDDPRLYQTGRVGDDNVIRYSMSLNGQQVDLSWPYNQDNHVLLYARSPRLDEFVLGGNQNRLYITIKALTPMIDLPSKNSMNVFYSRDGKKIFYTTFRDSIVEKHLVGFTYDRPFPDSIIAEYPSLREIRSILHAPPTMKTDTIPDR
jgi:hypothetical protein